ncbi:hypothetical protein DFH29DRAFT_888126, partial [Suillus ampliporus]
MQSLLTPTIVIPIENYAIFSFLNISIRTLMPLFLSTPMHLGGLGFAPPSIGPWLALIGISDASLLRVSVVLRPSHAYVSDHVVTCTRKGNRLSCNHVCIA